MSKPLFDEHCYDLASSFLEDSNGGFTHANAVALAAEIQQVIERFIDNLDPTPE